MQFNLFTTETCYTIQKIIIEESHYAEASYYFDC